MIQDMIDDPLVQETARVEDALTRAWQDFHLQSSTFACVFRTRRLPTMPPNVCKFVADSDVAEFARAMIHSWPDLPERDWAFVSVPLRHQVYLSTADASIILLENDPHEVDLHRFSVATEIVVEIARGTLSSALFALKLPTRMTPAQLITHLALTPCEYISCEFWTGDFPIFEAQDLQLVDGAHLQVFVPLYLYSNSLNSAGFTGLRWLQLWNDQQQRMPERGAFLELRNGRTTIKESGQLIIYRMNQFEMNSFAHDPSVTIDVRTTTLDEVLEQMILDLWTDLIEDCWRWVHVNEAWRNSRLLEPYSHVMTVYNQDDPLKVVLTSIEYQPPKSILRIKPIRSEQFTTVATLLIECGASRVCFFETNTCLVRIDGRLLKLHDLINVRQGSFVQITISPDRDQSLDLCSVPDFAEDIAHLVQRQTHLPGHSDHRILDLSRRTWTRATIWLNLAELRDQCHSIPTSVLFRTTVAECTPWEDRALEALRNAIPSHPSRQRSRECRLVWPQPPPAPGSVGIVQMIATDYVPVRQDHPILMDITGLDHFDRTILYFWSHDGIISGFSILMRRQMLQKCATDGWCSFRYLDQQFSTEDFLPLRPFTYLELLFVPYPQPQDEECDTMTPSSISLQDSTYSDHATDEDWEGEDPEHFDQLQQTSFLQMELHRVSPHRQAVIVLARLPPPGNGTTKQVKFNPHVEVWTPSENRVDWIFDSKVTNDFLADFMCTTDSASENPYVLNLMRELGWSATNPKERQRIRLKLDELIPYSAPTLWTSTHQKQPCGLPLTEMKPQDPPIDADTMYEPDLRGIHAPDYSLCPNQAVERTTPFMLPQCDFTVGDFYKFLIPWPDHLERTVDHLELHAFSKLAIGMTDHHFESTPLKIHIYTDGSFRNGQIVDDTWRAPHATWSFVVLFQHEEGFSFGGYMVGDVIDDKDPRFDAYGIGAIAPSPLTAEQCALCWGATWAIQHIANLTTPPPELHFHFDSQVAGYKAEGTWGPPAVGDTVLTFAARAYFQILRNLCPTYHHHVKGHSGQPWNECADAIARARLEGFICDLTPQVEWPASRTQREFLAWMGNLTPSSGFSIVEDQLLLEPVVPATSIPFSWCPIAKQKSCDISFGRLTALVASYNVMSLQQRGRLEMLRLQCKRKGIHIVGLQETRDKDSRLWQSQDFIRVTSAATKEGQGGLQLWIHRETPFFFVKGRAVRINQTFLTVTHASPELLCVTIIGEGLRMGIVVGHAPHSKSPNLDDWWNFFHATIAQLPVDLPCIWLIDANCRMHGFDDSSCGSLSPPIPRDHIDASNLFHAELVQQDNFLPCTFSEIHSGPSYTWTLGDFAKGRLDYVAIPSSWRSGLLRTWVEQDIRSGASEQDHSMTMLQIDVEIPVQPHGPRRSISYDRQALDTMEGKQQCAEIFNNAPVIPAWVDSSLHCHLLETYLQMELRRRFPFTRRQKKKSFISDSTYSFILQLRSLRRQMKNSNMQRDRHILGHLFGAWRSLTYDHAPPEVNIPIRSFDLNIAQSLAAIQRARTQLSSALKYDHGQYRAEIVDRISNAQPSEIFEALLPLLPKHRRGVFSAQSLPGLLNCEGLPTTSTAETARVFQEYFGKAEGGTQLNIAEMEENFLANQHRHIEMISPLLPMMPREEIPSLQLLEGKIRRLKRGKAYGPDGLPTELFRAAPAQAAYTYYSLMVKTNVLGLEPLQWKGGIVKPIFKRGNAKDPASWRNILISSTPGKLVHSMLRDGLHAAYQRHHAMSQFGGVTGASIAVPTIAVRSFLSICKKRSVSCAVLFVDGMEAFYRMLRELVFDFEDVEVIHQRLQNSGYSPPTISLILEKIQEANALQRQHVSVHRQAVLKATHSDSWFCVTGEAEKVCSTSSGSRPGDPVADILFNMLMSRTLDEIRSKFVEAGISNHITISNDGILSDSARPHQPYQDFFDGQAWVDDLAFLLASDSPEELLDTVKLASSIVSTSLASNGVTMNLKAGKTEAMVSFRGRNSRNIRRQLHCDDDAMIAFTNHEEGVSMLGVTPRYKYLGSLLSINSGCTADIRQRTSITFVALRSLRRPVFCNQALSLKGKITVLNAVIMSKLLATAGSWILTTKKEQQCFHSNVMRIYRFAFRAIFPGDPSEHISNEKVVKQLGVLTATELLYTHHIRALLTMIRTAPPYAWALLNQDQEWFFILDKAFYWMHDFLYPHPANHHDHFDLQMLVDWAFHSPQEVKKCLKIIQRATFEHRHRVHQAYMWETEFAALLPSAGFAVSESQAPPPIASDLLDDGYMCGVCGKTHIDFRTLTLHMSKVHGIISAAKLWATSTRCEVCLQEFHTKAKLKRHFERGGFHCLQAMQAYYEKPSPEDEHLHEPPDPKPCFRIPGPLTPWFASAAELQGPRRIPVEHRPEPIPIQGHEHDPLASFSYVGNDTVPHQFPQARVILHLFSGRRREGDLQHELERVAAQQGTNVFVISLDLAVDATRGNLACPATKKFWIEKLKAGYVLGFTIGPPCETYSRSRFRRELGPPPIRSEKYPWGIKGISHRHHLQVDLSNGFVQYALLLMLHAVIFGVRGLLEHPGPYKEEDSLCIWELMATILLRQHPCIAFHLIRQGEFGQISMKPTGLLTAHMPLFQTSLDACRLPRHQWNNSSIKMGKSESGRGFSTAPLKEYPEAMNRAIAQALLQPEGLSVPDFPTDDCQRFLEEVDSMIVGLGQGESNEWLPDFNLKSFRSD